MDMNTTEAGGHVPSSSAEAWGYGILCTSIINLCSLTGVLFLPIINGYLYKRVLIYMVGLAVGTLAGSSLLFLIPEALELTDQELDRDSHVWKCLTILLGIYVFFINERMLKMISKYRRKRQTIRERELTGETNEVAFSSSFQKNDKTDTPSNNIKTIENGKLPDDNKSASKSKDSENGLAVDHHHGHSHNQIAPVAWSIIFGDGLHNFIDGVSIGAAFTESILAGVSVSLAIFCEELPHELGDFAVLLNAGMKVKKAIFFNFLSAVMCYLGLVVGIFLGENTATHTWVFAFAGGMFLYISLVDMMPEMNSADESKENKDIGAGWIFLLQNLGLLTGLGLMLIMAVYGGDLEHAIHRL